MYNNADLIDELDNWKNQIAPVLREHRVASYKLNDIGMGNDTLRFNDVDLTKQAVSKILNVLRVKRKFMDFGKEEPINWKDVLDRIVALCGDGNIYARHIVTSTGEEKIVDVYFQTMSPTMNNAINPLDYFQTITDGLANSDRKFRLHSKEFNEVSGMVDFGLVDDGIKYDLLGISDEVWCRGVGFSFDFLSFSTNPFLERLICTNGLSIKKSSKPMSILSKKFNLDKIEKGIIGNLVEDKHLEIDGMLAIATDHLNANNISLQEFYTVRKLMQDLNDKGVYDFIIEQHFDDNNFFEMYNTDVNEKPIKWLSTADSGINAYDFFNRITYIISHRNITNIQQHDRLRLEIEASNLLFKPELDLEMIAPRPYSYQTGTNN